MVGEKTETETTEKGTIIAVKYGAICGDHVTNGDFHTFKS